MPAPAEFHRRTAYDDFLSNLIEGDKPLEAPEWYTDLPDLLVSLAAPTNLARKAAYGELEQPAMLPAIVRALRARLPAGAERASATGALQAGAERASATGALQAGVTKELGGAKTSLLNRLGETLRFREYPGVTRPGLRGSRSTRSLAKPFAGRLHGTQQPIEHLTDEFYSPTNIYGQGFYTTNDAGVARGYAGEGHVYEVVEKRPGLKLLDIEKPIPGPIKAAIAQNDYGASILADKPNMSLREWFDEVRWSARDEFYTRDDIQEVFEGVRERAEQMGYAGYRHLGGALSSSGPMHEVHIYFRPANDLILRPFRPVRLIPAR